QDLFRFFAVS
ncbi:peptidase M50 family protein, partial [Chlamydia psittaci 84-8471/1]